MYLEKSKHLIIRNGWSTKKLHHWAGRSEQPYGLLARHAW